MVPHATVVSQESLLDTNRGSIYYKKIEKGRKGRTEKEAKQRESGTESENHEEQKRRKQGDLSVCIFLEIQEKEKSLYLGLISGSVDGGGRFLIWKSLTVLASLCNNQPTI